MKVHRASCFAFALLAGAATLSSQEPAQQTPTFRTRADAVTVDVSATDSRGKPVTDLTIDDFEVKENGKLQKIDTFKRFTTTEATTPRPAVAITSLDVQEREAARDDVRLIAIFLDDYHTRLGNGLSIREKLARFVEGLDPRDMVAVMYPLTPSTAITFSRNHDGTARAIRQFEGRKYNYLPRYPQEEVYNYMSRAQIEALRTRVVIDALTGLCTVMGGFRDGRKTVLMVSEGVTSYFPPQALGGGPGGAMVPALSGLPPGSAVSPTPGASTTSNQFQADIELLNRMKDIFVAAQRANAAVYTLDPRGLAVFEFDLGQAPVDLGTDRRVLDSQIDSLRIIADNAGGRAIVGSNDPGPGLQQMLVDASAYYLLGYTSTESARDGKFHEISVRVKRKGVDFRARKGYWAYSAEDVARMSAPERPALPPEMTEALAAAASRTKGRALNTWIGFDRAPSDGRAAVALIWEMTPPASPADTADRISVLATSSSGDLLYRGRATVDPKALPPSGRITFAAPPGTMHVRVSAEGASGQFIDSEERDIRVPDFATTGPRVTTPEIYRARTARELAQIRASTTALPTAARQFTRTDQLLLRFRAYGPGGSTPSITARLINARGENMSTLTVPPARPDGAFDLPIMPSGLAPGAYAIEIEAVSGGDRSSVFWGFSIGG